MDCTNCGEYAGEDPEVERLRQREQELLDMAQRFEALAGGGGVMKSEELEELIFLAIGETTAIFMSNPLPGTDQVMPDQECARIGHDLALKISKLVRDSRGRGSR